MNKKGVLYFGIVVVIALIGGVLWLNMMSAKNKQKV